MTKELHPVFLKTQAETETRFKIEFFYGPKTIRDPGLNSFTDQNRDEVQINGHMAIVPGGYGSRKMARVNSSLREADPPQ